MRIRVTLLLALYGLIISSAHASQWTNSCDKPGLTQSSTVCLVESYSFGFWDKQSAAKQGEIAARQKRWGYRKAEAYCRTTGGYGSVPGPTSYEQDILERKKGEVYVGIRINPQCTESKKVEKASQPSSITGSVARKLNEQQKKKLKELSADCKRDPKSRACDELKALQEEQHTVAVGGDRG